MEEWEMSDYEGWRDLTYDELTEELSRSRKRSVRLGGRIAELKAQIESLQREKAEIDAELKRAYADLESIRRGNEELKAELAARTHNYEYWREYAESLKAAAITPEMREKWHRVASLNPVAGIVYNEPNEVWPEDGEWVLIEIKSASGISYETRVHDDRSWPSFGVRWAYIRDLLGEQG